MTSSQRRPITGDRKENGMIVKEED